jgi:hypothetical protein
MKPCKKKSCGGRVTPPGRVHCEKCRKKRCQALQEYLRLADEVKAARNRKNRAKYQQSRTAKAIAYRQRHAKSRASASAAWAAKNPGRKALIARLYVAIEKGDITKPNKCDDCKMVKSPIVAYGLEDQDGVQVQAWTCWGCWWARKRGEA